MQAFMGMCLGPCTFVWIIVMSVFRESSRVRLYNYSVGVAVF